MAKRKLLAEPFEFVPTELYWADPPRYQFVGRGVRESLSFFEAPSRRVLLWISTPPKSRAPKRGKGK